MISFEQIQMFVAAVDKGSFSAAARFLNKSPSAVSLAVTALEDQLGVVLFDRSTKYPTATTAGRQLYAQSQNVLRQISRIESSCWSLSQGIETEIGIGLGKLIPIHMLESVIEKATQAFPHTKFRLVRDTRLRLIEQLEQGELDLVIHVNAGGKTKLVDFDSIGFLRFNCVCSPDSALADMEVVDNETLLSERQLICEAMLENPALKEQGISNEVWEISDQEDVIRLVEQGIGWALLPDALAREREVMGFLKVFKPEFQQADILVSVDSWTTARARGGPVCSALLEQLPAVFRIPDE